MEEEKDALGLNVQNFDPLYRLLAVKLRLSPFWFGMAVFLADVLVDGYLGLRYDVFWQVGKPPGLLQDYMALVTDFIFNPITCGIYLWTTIGINTLFEQMYRSSIFSSKHEFRNILKQMSFYYQKKWIFILALVTSFLFTLSQLGGYFGKAPWKAVAGYLELNPLMSYWRAPFWFVMFYAFFFAAFNVAVTIIVLRKIFRKASIQILPLHPDGCGGLGSISRFSLRIGFAIGAIGLLLSTAVITEVMNGKLLQSTPVLIGVVAYVVFAPLFFFLPLGTAHGAMQDAREAEILSLAKQFAVTFAKVKDSINSPEESNYSREIERLENIKKLYKVADEFPVWPFDTRSIRRFLAVVTTPLLPALITILTELVRPLLVP
jgi:hypothetical protein